jgi:hypothetical protein
VHNTAIFGTTTEPETTKTGTTKQRTTKPGTTSLRMRPSQERPSQERPSLERVHKSFIKEKLFYIEGALMFKAGNHLDYDRVQYE